MIVYLSKSVFIMPHTYRPCCPFDPGCCAVLGQAAAPVMQAPAALSIQAAAQCWVRLLRRNHVDSDYVQEVFFSCVVYRF